MRREMSCSVDRAELIRLRQDLEDAQAHKDALSADFISRMGSMTAEERVGADMAAARVEQRSEDTFHEDQTALRAFTGRGIDCCPISGPKPKHGRARAGTPA